MKFNIIGKKIHHRHLFRHETKRHVLLKFLMVLGVFISYFIFISLKYGVQNGFWVTFLTWSFFVLCTPIADAGFLIAFPLRMITKIRMLYAQILVTIVAILLNIYVYFFKYSIYQSSKLLTIFEHILRKPFPFWIIIFISFIGTFISIQFGDELLDKASHHERVFHKRHKRKHQLVIMSFLFVFAIILYNILLKQLNLDFSI